MQLDSDQQELKITNTQSMYSMDLLNGGHVGGQPAFPGQTTYGSGPNRITLEQVDPSTFEDDSDDDDCYGKNSKPGKKTKGRVKIKMEFIENKLRRYTTFSKRKTGIMKKAYELSTLTGTQVMLLVASETGHVYTFATRKLQPMITSESGKALIQTCLNSPDPPPMAPGQQQAVEQRMNPGGFEETELTYAVDDENGKLIMDGAPGGLKPVYTLGGSGQLGGDSGSPSPSPQMVVPQTQTMSAIQQQQQQAAVTQQLQQLQQPTYQISQSPSSSSGGNVATIVQQPVLANSPSQAASKAQNGAASGISVQLPGLPPGILLQPGTSFTIPVQTSPQTSSTPASSPQQQQQQQQAVYRIPAPQQIISSSPQTASAMTPSVLMYQTPQGIVYAPATGPIQDKTVFNFQQPAATALSVAQDSGGGQPSTQQQQQIITIPVPVSLAGSPQVLQFSTADAGQLTDLSKPSAAKKARK